MPSAESPPENGLEGDDSSIDDDASRLGEHDGDARADARLNLAETPIGAGGITHDHSGLEKFSHRSTLGAERGEGSSGDIGGLVASRIYHDIINPLGAIGNGVELLGLTGQAEAPVIGLIEQSVATAIARLRFLHLALGAASKAQEELMLNPSELLVSLSKQVRVKFTWQIDDLVAAPLARLILLSVMCLEAAMPAGGTISIQRFRGGFKLMSEAPRLRDLPELWRAFEGRSSTAPLEAATLQFPMAARRARELGIMATTYRTEKTIEVSLQPDGRRSQ